MAVGRTGPVPGGRGQDLPLKGNVGGLIIRIESWGFVTYYSSSIIPLQALKGTLNSLLARLFNFLGSYKVVDSESFNFCFLGFWANEKESLKGIRKKGYHNGRL